MRCHNHTNKQSPEEAKCDMITTTIRDPLRDTGLQNADEEKERYHRRIGFDFKAKREQLRKERLENGTTSKITLAPMMCCQTSIPMPCSMCRS